MADKNFNVNINTTAKGDGAKKTDADIKKLKGTVESAKTSVDQLEQELKQAEAALSKADVGTKKFRALQNEIQKTKASLQGIKTGNIDAKGIDRLQHRLETLKARTQQAKTELETPPKTGWLESLGGKFGGLTAKITGATAGILSLGAILRTGFGRVAVTEDLTSSFTTLLGSIDKAQARIAAVTEFAEKTPLSIAGLATASRVLETLSGGALGAAESLRLVGDAAAIAQRPGESLDSTIQNVALHVARLNASLKAGKGEIGESTLRMQELGLITPELTAKLRELHKEGTRGQEAWALLENALKQFSGEMERRSQNITGLTSTLADAWGALTATLTRPFAPVLKSGISVLIGSLNGLVAAANHALEFFGIIPRRASAAADQAREKIAEVEQQVANLEDAVAKGGDAAKTTVDNLTNSYIRLEERIKLSVDRAKQLNDLRLEGALLDVEADTRLSPVEKVRRQAGLREAAGQAGLERTIQALERQAELERQRPADTQRAAAVNLDFANAIAGRLGEVADALKENKSTIENDTAAIADLEKQLTQLSTDIEANRKGPAVGSFGPDGRVAAAEFERQRAARLRELEAQRSSTTRELEERRARREEAVPAGNVLEKRLARLQEELAAAEEKASILTEQAQAERIQADREISRLQSEIEFQRQRAALERDNAQRKEEATLRQTVEKSTAESAKAAQDRVKDLEGAGGDILEKISKTLELMAERATTPAGKTAVESAAGRVETGNLEGVGAIAESAMRSLDDETRNLGLILRDQTAEVVSTMGRIVNTQQVGLQGLASVVVVVGSLESQMANVLESINRLHAQIKNNRQ